MFESPLPYLVIGLIAEVFLAVAFVNTRRGALLLAMLGVVALVLAGVAVEWLVVTEREAIEASLFGAARALEADDREGVLSYVADDALDTRAKVNDYWFVYRITQVKFRNLKILVTGSRAMATFDAVVYGRDRAGAFAESPYPLDVKIGLTREGQRWLIDDRVEYEKQRL